MSFNQNNSNILNNIYEFFKFIYENNFSYYYLLFNFLHKNKIFSSL